ncbi:hypothetical protein DFS34DRAFT_612210 [Phlyctochytrium arcticum]|nr:hypothetical protein DFS34DRAFT_612210 [Phlyctochytrium arcticum]
MASDRTTEYPPNAAMIQGSSSPGGPEKRKRESVFDVEGRTPKTPRIDESASYLRTPVKSADTPKAKPASIFTDIKSQQPATLTSDQRQRLEKAKLFARDATLKILQVKLGQNPLLAPNSASLAASLGARSIAVMSRIYVGSINFELTDQDIKAVFSQFGFVRSVSMTMDPATAKHKGFCFVEYEVPEAAELALDLMNGAELGGRQLKVGRPNNYNPSVSSNLPPPSASRIYIANINEFVSESNIASIFEPFGKIVGCALLPDLVSRKHKGNGYIEFEEESSALAALASMNNFELGGQHLRLMKALVGGPLPDGMKSLDSLPQPTTPISAAVPASVLNVAHNINNTIAQKLGAQSSILPVGTLSSLNIPNTGLLNPALQNVIANVQARVSEENNALEENVSISASQRYSIMQKLMRGTDINPTSNGADNQVATPVITLKNMVVYKEVDDTLNDEIFEECSKYGSVIKVLIWVDPVKQSADKMQPDDAVDIYVQFEGSEGAGRARNALDNRFFAGKRVKAQYASLSDFFKMVEQSAS